MHRIQLQQVHDRYAFLANVLQCTKTTSRGRFSIISGNVGWFLIPFRANREQSVSSGGSGMRVIGFDRGFRRIG